MPSLELLSGCLGVLLGAGSYLLRSHRALTLTAAAAVLAWAMHFACKEAWTATALMALSSVRIAAGAWVVHFPRNRRLGWTTGISALVLCLALATWAGWHSAPAMLATLTLTYAGFNLPYERLRPGLAVGELLWFANGALVGSSLAMAAAALGCLLNLGMMFHERRTA